MNQTSADFLAAAKMALGNPYMSDRELGERLGGFSQPAVGKAKVGNMSDNMAAAVGKLLEEKGVVTAGIVLLTARVEREKDADVRGVWEELLGKISPLMPAKSAAHLDLVSGGMGMRPSAARSALAGAVLAVALTAGAPSPSQASTPIQTATAERVCIM